MAPVLSPQIVDSHHPFPHLEGKVLHIAALLAHKKNERLGLLPVPASLPALVFLPGPPGQYVPVEDILLEYADPQRGHQSGRRNVRRGGGGLPQTDGKAPAPAPPYGRGAR